MSEARSNSVEGKRTIAGHLLTLFTWLVGLVYFFPIFWMVLSGFKEEFVAHGSPKLFFDPTNARYDEVTTASSGRLTAGEAFANSAWIVGVSTLIVLILAIPAAYALSIKPINKWKDVLFFFISTKFLPIVAAILPLYIIANKFDLLGTRILLIVLYTAMNLPLAVWMLRSFFAEVPKELIEAAQIDGAKLRGQITSVILPIVAPGVAATALLCVIFGWNEFFLAAQLNSANAKTVPLWVLENVDNRDLFLAKLSAASTLAILPVVLAGWVAQKRMIRGLAMGAIK